MNENWQNRSREFAEKHNLHHSPGVYVLDLLSELGEVAKEVLLATQYGERPFPTTPPVTLSNELGDTLFSLCQLASSVGVDLEQSLNDVLQKYEHRWQTRQQIGSREL